jgi:hypothetical protein
MCVLATALFFSFIWHMISRRSSNSLSHCHQSPLSTIAAYHMGGEGWIGQFHQHRTLIHIAMAPWPKLISTEMPHRSRSIGGASTGYRWRWDIRQSSVFSPKSNPAPRFISFSLVMQTRGFNETLQATKLCGMLPNDSHGLWSSHYWPYADNHEAGVWLGRSGSGIGRSKNHDMVILG